MEEEGKGWDRRSEEEDEVQREKRKREAAAEGHRWKRREGKVQDTWRKF